MGRGTSGKPLCFPLKFCCEHKTDTKDRVCRDPSIQQQVPPLGAPPSPPPAARGQTRLPGGWSPQLVSPACLLPSRRLSIPLNQPGKTAGKTDGATSLQSSPFQVGEADLRSVEMEPKFLLPLRRPCFTGHIPEGLAPFLSPPHVCFYQGKVQRLAGGWPSEWCLVAAWSVFLSGF